MTRRRPSPAAATEMEALLVAYALIAAMVAHYAAGWLKGRKIASSWFSAFKPAFVAAFVLLWLGDAGIW